MLISPRRPGLSPSDAQTRLGDALARARLGRRRLFLVVAACVLLVASAGLRAQPEEDIALAPDAPQALDGATTDTRVRTAKNGLVYRLHINTDRMAGDMIDRHHHYELHRTLLAAQQAGADALLLELNTNGGALDAAMMINDRLLQLSPLEIETITWVNTRAISAGAMIALSSDHIIMAPGSTIGAALPVTLGGEGGSGMQAGDAKVISAVAKQMQSAAEANGHPGNVAAAMVDPSRPLEGYTKKGEILTLTDTEAIEPGLADGHASTIDEVLEFYGLGGARVVELQLSTLENIAAFLSRSTVTSALMAVAFIALIVEIKTPGVGLPLMISAIAFGLAMFGGFMADLAGLLEPILLVVGLGLLLVELFVLPGFGLPGVSGILLIVVSLVLSMNNIPDAASGIMLRWLAPTVYALLGAMFGTLIGLPIVLKALPSIPYFGSMMMESPADETPEEAAKHAPAPDPRDALRAGMLGLAETPCRPAGIGRFGGELFDIIAEGMFVEKGQEIELRRVEGNRVIVVPRRGETA
jgi:membrane-bound serine protease (ClpP class)